MNRIKTFFANTFIGGLVVLLPMLIFFFLLQWLISLLNGMLDPLVQLIPFEVNTILAKLILFIIILGLCFSFGLFIRTTIGNATFSFIENGLLKKLPFYSIIKETVIQFLGNDKTPFKEVVLVKTFGGSAKMIGFVTSKSEEGMYTIFVPTAPNPTSGFVIFLEEKDVEHIDITIEEAMRTNIGLGRGAEKMIKFKK